MTIERVSLASANFGRLKGPIGDERGICEPLKVRLYKALISYIATYAAETWILKSKDGRMLEIFKISECNPRSDT